MQSTEDTKIFQIKVEAPKSLCVYILCESSPVSTRSDTKGERAPLLVRIARRKRTPLKKETTKKKMMMTTTTTTRWRVAGGGSVARGKDQHRRRRKVGRGKRKNNRAPTNFPGILAASASDDVAMSVATMERSSGEASTSGTSASMETIWEETEAIKNFKLRPGRHACFSAKKSGTIDVLENTEDPARSLREYMSLPATSYSTLDGETVKRIDDYTFECILGTLSFLGFKITPTVTAKVDVRPNGVGPMISVEEATISGSKIVEDANEQFQLSSVNDVSWFDSATEECPNQKTIQSETMVSVYLIVPGWFPFTVKSTERTGRFVVNQVVGQVVPRFLKQLKADYEVWSLGDDSRKAVCEGGLFDVDQSEKNPDLCDVSEM